jgi:magnesium transporter
VAPLCAASGAGASSRSGATPEKMSHTHDKGSQLSSSTLPRPLGEADVTDAVSAIFHDGLLVERVSLAASAPQAGEADFIWIELRQPTDEAFESLRERFHLHGLAIDDAMSSTQVAKVNLYGDQIFVVMKFARLEQDEIKYAETEAFVSKHHIITVHHEDQDEFVTIRERFDAPQRSALVRPDFILHAIMDLVVESYFPVVQMIEDEVLSIEQKLLSEGVGHDGVTRLFQLRHESMRFQHMITRMLDVCGKLINLDVPCIGSDVRPYFRDVHDHLIRLDGMIGGLIEIIRAVFEASTLLEQQRQGVITRQLAAWAAIFGVPAALAGLHEMIFARTPEVVTAYGYFTTIGLMILVCLTLYLRFRSLRWL